MCKNESDGRVREKDKKGVREYGGNSRVRGSMYGKEEGDAGD